MINYKRQYSSFDFPIFILTIAIAIFGIILVGSATHVNVYGTSSVQNSQILFFVTGLFILLATAFIDYNFICKFYILIYIINILLLIASLVYGHFTNAVVARWIYIGPFGLQPSEFTKIFMILFLSTFLAKINDDFNTVKNIFLTAIFIAIPFLLIAAQPSLSASLVTLFISASIVFAAGLDKKIIIFAILFVAIFGIIFLIDVFREAPLFADLILKDYQIERITSTFHKDATDDSFYQTNYAIQAISSGQLWGNGLYNGTLSQLNYLAESHNDLIFAVLGEEFGFVGTTTILVAMFFLILRCLQIGFRSIDLTGKLICTGVASMLFFQTFVNAGVSSGLLPNTGMPFPFLSSGGSAMWINLACIGLVINVGMSKKKNMF